MLIKTSGRYLNSEAKTDSKGQALFLHRFLGEDNYTYECMSRQPLQVKLEKFDLCNVEADLYIGKFTRLVLKTIEKTK
jgi:hypothetical protein